MKDDNLWIHFSRYIRLRDSDEHGFCRCFTCNREPVFWNSGMQAGHFIGRRHWATKYHEQNVHAQCPNCNHFNGGMQFEYALKLDERYGEGKALELRALSQQTVKISEIEIKEMTKKYRELSKRLAQERGFTLILKKSSHNGTRQTSRRAKGG